MRNLRNKIVFIFFASILATWVGFNLRKDLNLVSSQNRPHNRENSIGKTRDDLNLKGSAENRLGFGISTTFQVVPKFWKNVLSTTKEVSIPLFTKTKRILLYDIDRQWKDPKNTYCPLYNADTEFKCEFIDISKNVNKSNSLENLVETVDAILILRNYRHTDNVQRLLDVAVIKNRNNAAADVGLGRAILIPKLIYWTAEAPFGTNSFSMLAQPKYKQAAKDPSRDYLATYWRGSDIYSPYFAFKPFNKSVLESETNKIRVNYAKGRFKMAAIVVSNCGANNNRLGLVRELQKYIDVDVYGRCGTLKCDRQTCFNEIRKEYKFYLAFENSNCRDYITEKLFKNAFSNDLLPIVMGAHPSDYKAIAPANNSYIHIDDFDSVQKLSEYLKLLDKNDTLYNSYFSWKNKGRYENEQNNFFCEACAFLHVQSITKNQIQENINQDNHEENASGDASGLPYFNFIDEYSFEIFNWSSSDTRMCLKRNQWFWNQ